MTITYDYYPFRPDDYAAVIAPYVHELGNGQSGEARLRQTALTLFDTNNNVRELASNYGGWTRDAMVEAIELSPAFWLILFLYAHFCTIDEQAICQQVNPSTISYLAKIAGWDEQAHRIFTHGKRTFNDFARQWLYKDTSNQNIKLPDFWNTFHPHCMLGHLGWLDLSDIDTLLGRLVELEAHLPSLDLGSDNTQKFAIQVSRMKDAFLVALEHNYCLSIIQSA